MPAICSRLDLKALRLASGLEDLSSPVGYARPMHEVCRYVSTVRTAAAVGIDVYDDPRDVEFETSDSNQGFAFEPLTGLGLPARSGGNETGVDVQLRSRGRRLVIGISEQGTSAASLRPRAIALARLLVAGLAAPP